VIRPIADVARDLGLAPAEIEPWGPMAAKLRVRDRRERRGRLVLVSAITPTKHGEGKTTVSIGLGLGLAKVGSRALVCLRQPSMGPVFGLKGGGAGGGKAALVPADRVNLHFTGDIHAIGAAHNLLAAIAENALRFDQRLDPRGLDFPRVIDVDDRALRKIVVGLGGKSNGVVRETRFDITAASEVMAVFALARSFEDLEERLGRIVLGTDRNGAFVRASELECHRAMAALLSDAFLPNLVQTSEGSPVLVHGGPFANIAHGASSVAATDLALGLADVVVTEAGFGFELGGEKFLHIKCRSADLWPDAVVLVATVRALAAHGDGDLARGVRHLDRQVENVRAFGISPVIALNVFDADAENDLAAIEAHARTLGVRTARIDAFRDGGEGGRALAETVLAALLPSEPRYLYALDASPREKLDAIATTLYGGRGVDLDPEASEFLVRAAKAGASALPICVAKTHLSLTDDPKKGVFPEPFELTVTSARLAAGAGFVVALLGDISTMPGLPKESAAKRIRVGPNGIEGLG
jgi:formate--tetrahydrofolate ligase